MTKPTICLASMVKQENRIIERMLQSAAFVDRWCVLDTGSDDGTQETVEKFFANLGTPGHLYEEPFINYAESRNRLLELARQEGCDYLLLLDADHVLHVEPGALDALTFDSYLIELRSGTLVYQMPYLIASRAKATYLSPTHEFLSFEDPFVQVYLPGVWLEHREDGGNRHDKFERDEALLEAEYVKDPNNQRTCFYLAQTIEHKDRDRAVSLYRRRFELGGWDEERYVALVRIAGLTGDLGDWLRAWSFRPRRWEATTGVVKKLHEAGLYDGAYRFGKMALTAPRRSGDILFVETAAETWAFDLEFGLAAFYAGHADEAKGCWESVLASDAPQDIKDCAQRNIGFC